MLSVNERITFCDSLLWVFTLSAAASKLKRRYFISTSWEYMRLSVDSELTSSSFFINHYFIMTQLILSFITTLIESLKIERSIEKIPHAFRYDDISSLCVSLIALTRIRWSDIETLSAKSNTSDEFKSINKDDRQRLICVCLVLVRSLRWHISLICCRSFNLRISTAASNKVERM